VIKDFFGEHDRVSKGKGKGCGICLAIVDDWAARANALGNQRDYEILRDLSQEIRKARKEVE